MAAQKSIRRQAFWQRSVNLGSKMSSSIFWIIIVWAIGSFTRAWCYAEPFGA